MIVLFCLFAAAVTQARAADSCSTISSSEGDLTPLSIFSTAPTAANAVYRLDTSTPTGSDVTTKTQTGRSLNSTANCPADCVFQLITYYANDIGTNEPFDYLYIDPQYVAFVPYPFVRDDSVDPVTCAKLAGYCGATVPIYRYYKFTWKGIAHAYSYSNDLSIPGYVQERDPLCYIWPEVKTTVGPAMNPTQNPSPPDSCGLPLGSADLVPLKVYDNLQWGPMRDHYYTTKLPNSTDLSGYVPMDLPVGMVSLTNNSKCGCLVELNQMLDNTTGTFPRMDHKLADLTTEKNRIYEFYQPTGEEIYCVSEPSCGATIPIYKHYQYFDFDSILTNSPEYMMYSYLYPYIPLCYIWNTTLADPGATTDGISNSTGQTNATSLLPTSNGTTLPGVTGSSTVPPATVNSMESATNLPSTNQTVPATNSTSAPSIAPGNPTMVPAAPPTGSSNPTANSISSPQTNVTVSAATGATVQNSNPTSQAPIVTGSVPAIAGSVPNATSLSSVATTNGILNPTGPTVLTTGNSQVSGITGPPATGLVPNATNLPVATTNGLQNPNPTTGISQVTGLTGSAVTGSVPNVTGVPPAPPTNGQVSINSVATTVGAINNPSLNTGQPSIGPVTTGSISVTGILPVTTMAPAGNLSANTNQPLILPVTGGVTGPTAITGALPTNGVNVNSGPNPTLPPTIAPISNGPTTGFPAAPILVTINGSLPSIAPTGAPGATVLSGSVTSLPQNTTVASGLFGLPLLTTQVTPLPMTAAQFPIITGSGSGATGVSGASGAVTGQPMPMMIGSLVDATTAPKLPWNIFPVPTQAPTVEILTIPPTMLIPPVTFAPIVIGNSNSSQQLTSTQKPLDILITTGVGLPFAPNVPAAPVVNNTAVPSIVPAMAMGPEPNRPNDFVDSLMPELPTTINPLNSLTMFPGQGVMRDVPNYIPIAQSQNSAADSIAGSPDAGIKNVASEPEASSTDNNKSEVQNK